MRVGSSAFSWCCFILLLFVISPVTRSAVPENPFLGIPPQDENYYKTSSSGNIKCRDGSGIFTSAQLNDDFCDCPDGTDEPGTSACPAGKFYCRNAGHAPLSIFSSRVNDGICDCCDGSDEYDGQVKCPNTCWEAGKVARDKLKKKIATYKEGVDLRRKHIEEAKVAIAKDEAELSKLTNEESILKGLVEQLKERKEQIEKAEEKERQRKEKEEKQRKEAEEKENSETSAVEEKAKQEKDQVEDRTDAEDTPIDNTNHEQIGVLDDSPPDQDMPDQHADSVAVAASTDHSEIEGSPSNGAKQHLALDEEEFVLQKSNDKGAVVSETVRDTGNEVSPDQATNQEDGKSANSEELSREELGRLVASRWTGNADKQTEETVGTKDNEHEEHEDVSKSTNDDVSQYAHDDVDDAYASETDEDTGKYDDADADVEDNLDEAYEDHDHDGGSSSYKYESDDEVDLSDSTSSDNLSWLEKIQKSVRNMLQAVNIFQPPVNISEAAHVRKEYEEFSGKLSKIQSRISSLTQKLKHDFGTEKEFYSFYGQCFEVKQNKYVYKVCPFKQASQVEGHTTTRLGRWDKFEDSYRTMIFSSGDKCWNGPDRSLKVKLRCGLNNEVTDVDEPSRCEYVASLSTPALCLEEKLKGFEEKLTLMNQEIPQSHDEL